jgi:hypothetical protein
MSIGTRVIFVEGDRVTRVPLRRFERLCDGDRHAAMPEFAGQRVRCALVFVDLIMRKPAGIAHVDYIVLPFGSDGLVDPVALRHRDTLAIEAIGRLLGRVSEPVVEFGPYLAGRRYHDEFRWRPTEAQVRSLVNLALEGRGT